MVGQGVGAIAGTSLSGDWAGVCSGAHAAKHAPSLLAAGTLQTNSACRTDLAQTSELNEPIDINKVHMRDSNTIGLARTPPRTASGRHNQRQLTTTE